MAIMPHEPEDEGSEPSSSGEIHGPDILPPPLHESSILSLHDLLTSDEKFRLIVENAQEGILILDTDWLVMYCNTMFANWCGQSPTTLIGRPLLELVTVMTRDDLQRYLDAEIQGRQEQQEIRFQCQEQTIWAQLTATRLLNAEGTLICLCAVLSDISMQKRLESDLRAANRSLSILWESDRALLHLTEERAFLQEVCRILVDTGGYRLAWIGWRVHDETEAITPVASAGYSEGYLENLHLSWADTPWGQSPAGIAVRTGQPAVTQHILTDPRFTLWRSEALQHGYVSVLGLPIVIRDQTVGALSIYASEPETFSEPEVQLLTKLAGDLALGITALRTQRDRDLAEHALRKSEEKFRLIVETAQEGLVLVDALERIQYFNRQLADMLGYTVEEILGHAFLDLIHPDDRQHAADYFQHRRQGMKEKYDIRLVRQDGAILWVMMSATPIFDDTGTFISSMGMLIDITQRKAMEIAVEKERRFLFSAIDLLPIPIIFTDIEHGVFRSNRASEAFFGEAMQGQRWDVQLLRPDTNTPIPHDEWPIFRALQGETHPASEWTLRFPDGHEIPILLHDAPIYLNGKLSAAVIAFQDITALKALDRAKNQFLMVLSHELKTPLTSITGWAQMGLSEPEMMHDALENVARNAEKQKRILDKLLSMSRLLTGRVSGKLVATDLWMLAVQCYAELQRTPEAEQCTWSLQPPPQEHLPVAGDPSCLKEVIRQLLDNAIKYNIPHGNIILAGRVEEDQAVLSITDSGRGLTADQITQLFHPFQQLHRNEAKGGLGLGLAIAKGLIDLHHGCLWAWSAGLDQGSTFTVALPLQPSAAPPT